MRSIVAKFGSDEATIRFASGEKVIVKKGTSILQAALDNDIEMESFCGGCCSCSTCRVEIVTGMRNLSKMEEDEAGILGEKRIQNGDRLSCQAKVTGDVEIRIPDLF